MIWLKSRLRTVIRNNEDELQKIRNKSEKTAKRFQKDIFRIFDT
jgi:hypothetical protein